VVKQYAVADIHAIGFALVDDNPVEVSCQGLGAAELEGRGFLLQCIFDKSEKLAGVGLGISEFSLSGGECVCPQGV
jgi:hypothetical protein